MAPPRSTAWSRQVVLDAGAGVGGVKQVPDVDEYEMSLSPYVQSPTRSPGILLPPTAMLITARFMGIG